MAIVFRADLHPTKLELIGAWLPTQPWYPGGPNSRLHSVCAYRFDDPVGEVGVESHLVRVDGGPVLQVPLTYRDSPLPGAEPGLVGTMEHSVLGRRWVYDACADPVYVTALAVAVLTGGRQADEYVEADGQHVLRAATASVIGSGSRTDTSAVLDAIGEVVCSTDGAHTVCTAGGLRVRVRRILDSSAGVADGQRLIGTWKSQSEPVLLATVLR